MKPRLLIIELHHLGDAVMSLPFARGASERYEVHALCRPGAAAVYQMLERPPVIHAWEPPWGDDAPCSARAAIEATRTQGRVLRPLAFEAAVCAWADARAGILLAETRASRRVGFPMARANYYAADLPWRRRRLLLGRVLQSVWRALHPRVPMLTDPLNRVAPNQAHIRCWEQIADALGVACDYSTPWVQALPLPHEDISAFAREARNRGLQVLAIHLHARLPGKQWPLAQWRQLLALPEVTARFAVMEILPPGAEPLGLPSGIVARTPNLAALASALGAADAVLCHDSLPSHLGAALGKPVVAIFGSGEPDWFAPWQNRERVVQRRVCPLHPCIDRCGMDHYLCVERIAVGDALRQLQLLPLGA